MIIAIIGAVSYHYGVDLKAVVVSIEKQAEIIFR